MREDFVTVCPWCNKPQNDTASVCAGELQVPLERLLLVCIDCGNVSYFVGKSRVRMTREHWNTLPEIVRATTGRCQLAWARHNRARKAN